MSIEIATYIYYVIITFRTVFPFLLFTLIVIIAFAHTMYKLFLVFFFNLF